MKKIRNAKVKASEKKTRYNSVKRTWSDSESGWFSETADWTTLEVDVDDATTELEEKEDEEPVAAEEEVEEEEEKEEVEEEEVTVVDVVVDVVDVVVDEEVDEKVLNSISSLSSVEYSAINLPRFSLDHVPCDPIKEYDHYQIFDIIKW